MKVYFIEKYNILDSPVFLTHKFASDYLEDVNCDAEIIEMGVREYCYLRKVEGYEQQKTHFKR